MVTFFTKSLIACAGTLLLASTALPQQTVEARSVSYELNIPAENLDAALQALALASHHKLLYRAELVAGKASPALIGTYTTEEAVSRLLEGTKLTFEITPASVVLIKPAVSRESSPGAADPPRSDSQTTSDTASKSSKDGGGKNSSQDFRVAQVDQGSAGPQVSNNPIRKKSNEMDQELSEIIVTGTHIRGAPTDYSQLIVYDRDAIDRSGAVTLEDFSRQMPENFASVNSSYQLANRSATGRDESGPNPSLGAGFNLHGLGPAQTLTLINGHRIAAAGGNGQFVDISLIPLSAVERIEVLPDGASAIYGADAVAGVVNIILRSDYDGAETSARYGAATEGGGQETTVSQVLGRTWSGGSALLTYEYNKQDGLRATQRDFIPTTFGGAQGLGGSLIYPEQTRNSVMLTGQQYLGVNTTLSGDSFYSQRKFYQSSVIPLFSEDTVVMGTAKEYGATLDLSHAFLRSWHVDLSPSFYRTEQPQEANTVGQGYVIVDSSRTRIDLTLVDLRVDGTVAALPGGPAKMAAGVEFRRDALSNIDSEVFDGVSSPPVVSDLSRNVTSAFAELLLPIFGRDNGFTGVRRLELSLAERYDHYSTGQAAATPRISILWSPDDELQLHGSYAESFVAPRLDQMVVGTPQYVAENLPDSTSSTGKTDTLARSGGNPGLAPERSKTFTLGVEEKFSALPGLSLSATYFNTVFRGQIANPTIQHFSNILHDPTLGPFVNLSPNPADIAQLFNSGQVTDAVGLGAAGVEATFDERLANLAATRQSGVDFSTAYDRDVRYGRLGATLSATYLIKDDVKNTSTVPATVLLNQLGEPVNLRANAGLSWSIYGLVTAMTVHYVNHYENPLFSPTESISSWTTADFHVAYELPNDANQLVRGFTLALDVRNILGRAPPSVDLPVTFAAFNPGFDGANADALGRVVTLQLRKRW